MATPDAIHPAKNRAGAASEAAIDGGDACPAAASTERVVVSSIICGSVQFDPRRLTSDDRDATPPDHDLPEPSAEGPWQHLGDFLMGRHCERPDLGVEIGAPDVVARAGRGGTSLVSQS